MRNERAFMVVGLRVGFCFEMGRGKSPNDPKLSDCGARRAGCGKAAGAGWAQAAGRFAAASVTRGAVRCSAWLGASFLFILVPSIEFRGELFKVKAFIFMVLALLLNEVTELMPKRNKLETLESK